MSASRFESVSSYRNYVFSKKLNILKCDMKFLITSASFLNFSFANSTKYRKNDERMSANIVCFTATLMFSKCVFSILHNKKNAFLSHEMYIPSFFKVNNTRVSMSWQLRTDKLFMPMNFRKIEGLDF